MALGERYRRVANEKQWECFDESIEALSDDLAEVERIIVTLDPGGAGAPPMTDMRAVYNAAKA